MIRKNLKIKNLDWIFIGVLLISFTLYGATTLHIASAQATTTTVFLDPPSILFNAPSVGTTFTVNVTLANVTGLAGAQFTLSWNASLLTCTNIKENLYHTLTPSDFQDNIWSLALKYNNTAGTADYAQAWLDLGSAQTNGYAPANVTTATFPPDGRLALAVLTFNITSVPAVNMFSECNFTLTTVKLSDVLAAKINNTAVNGHYKIYGPPEITNTPIVNNGTTYTVTTVTNASVVPGTMTYDNTTYSLSFNLTGTDGTTGYVNVTIPTNLISLNKTTDQWTVTVNNTTVTPIISSNATDTFFYITTTFSTEPIKITGTVPEFPTLMLIPLLATVTMVAVELRRRRRM